MRRVSMALMLMLACACSSSEDRESKPTPTPTTCDVHATTAWAGFSDRSDAWGLSDPKLNGWVISAADLNGDGFLDLIAHVPAGNLRGSPTGDRYYSVLMNEAAPGGGRRFVDHTEESGYGTPPDGAPEYRVASGAVFGDVDNDGDVDVLSLAGVAPPQGTPTAADGDRTQLLLNDGSGKFTLAKNAGVATAEPQPVWGGTLVDWNLDGALDAFVANWFTPLGQFSAQQYLKGDGSGGFIDDSGVVGFTDAVLKRAATGVTACDLDDDGRPELAVSAYGRAPNLLLTPDAQGFMVDHAVGAGYAWDENQDYSDDQWFLCYCAQNPTAEGCAGAAPPKIACTQTQWSPGLSDQPERLGGNTFTTVCSDIDGDGRMDFYNAEIQHWWAGQASDPSALLLNRGQGGQFLFERPSRDQTGMHWEHVGQSWDEGGIDAAAGDLDNDGRKDVIVGRSDYYDQWGMIFHQQPDGKFVEAAKTLGIEHPCAATPIVADFDRDGDLDVVMASSRMREWCAGKWARNEIRFYENSASQSGSWLAVRLVGNGTTANRSAIGAKVTVEVGEQRLVEQVVGGYGHGGVQQDLVVFFGLGDCDAVAAIEVRWPDAATTVERWEKVEARRFVELKMGDGAVTVLSGPDAPGTR